LPPHLSPSPSLSTPSWVSSDLAATERIAAAVAVQLAPPDVVNVVGELGAGKTAFVRAACAALGVTDPVTSPTFTVGNRYRGGPFPVSHLDLYRSAGVSPEEWADLEPYFDDAVCFVEWPEPGAGVLPPPRLTVELRFQEGDARLVSLRSELPELLAAIADSLA
jgi:tRNA threonylcarbamoyladenosine biosynthesis protein TsaE